MKRQADDKKPIHYLSLPCSSVKEIAVEARRTGADHTEHWFKVTSGSLAEPQQTGEQSCVVMPQLPASDRDVEFRLRAVQLHGHSRYWCIYNARVLVEVNTLLTMHRPLEDTV